MRMSDEINARYNGISDWQVLVNKPVVAKDGQEVGIVRSIQPESIRIPLNLRVLFSSKEATR
jgi:hypothetical protein